MMYVMNIIGADSTGGTGTSSPVLLKIRWVLPITGLKFFNFHPHIQKGKSAPMINILTTYFPFMCVFAS